MKDSFEAAGLDIKVSIGLRTSSPSCDEARACGFSEDAGTLGEVYDVVSRADLVILLISDGAQARAATLACSILPAGVPARTFSQRSPGCWSLDWALLLRAYRTSRCVGVRRRRPVTTDEAVRRRGSTPSCWRR